MGVSPVVEVAHIRGKLRVSLNAANHRNVEQREDVLLCGWHDKAGHVGVCQRSCGARVEHRRHAGSQTGLKRIDRIQPDAAENMHMQIDQTRSHHQSIGLDYLFPV